jgi:hypothetical protein
MKIHTSLHISAPSDPDLHCSVLIHLVISDQEATSADPDMIARMCLLIWIDNGHTCQNLYIWSKVLTRSSINGEGEHFSTRSSVTSVPSDQDLYCLCFDLLDYF